MSDDALYEFSTLCNTYSIVDEHYNGRPARVLYTANKLAAQSGIPRDNNPEMLFDYNERFMELVRGLLPERILVIGGGAFTFPRAIIEQFPDTYLDVVELDKELYPIACSYFDFVPSQRTNVFIADGLDYLRTTDQKYSFIVIDVFEGGTLPKGFQTDEFASLLNNSLTPYGIVAMNIIAAIKGLRAASLQRQFEAMRRIFSETKIFPAGYGVSTWNPQNLLLTASQSDHQLTPLLRYADITSEL